MNRNRKPRDYFEIDGILLVDKPGGMTSHDVVDRIRRTFSIKKVGHGGTLDPMATGLLVILVGKGTKCSQQVMGADKGYEGVMQLGISTDSHDLDGEITAEHDPSGVTGERLREELAKWAGEVEQIPPMVSAIKKGGKPLYKLAREGKTIERDPRPITIHELELLSFENPKARFRMLCSKGTYVRTLSADVGEGLGCGAHLCELRRTRSGDYSIEDARPLEEWLDLSKDELREAALPLPAPPAPDS